MSEQTWLTYPDAARRVNRSRRAIRRWRRAGMHYRIRDGRVEFELEELLAWYRRRTLANPTHVYRLRHARANAHV